MLLAVVALMAAVASKALPAAPIGKPGNWVTTEDYPMEALRDRAEGVASLLFQIGLDGAVSNCVIVSSSGSPLLDATACAVFSARAKFSPSTDQDGKPIVSTGTHRIRWQIPDQPAEGYPLNPGRKALQFEVSETGSVENCKLTGSVAVPSEAQQKACARYSAQRFRIFRKADGTPVRKTVIMSQELEIRDIPAASN
jgi:protein TonB